jgi:hypothetical protein
MDEANVEQAQRVLLLSNENPAHSDRYSKKKKLLAADMLY